MRECFLIAGVGGVYLERYLLASNSLYQTNFSMVIPATGNCLCALFIWCFRADWVLHHNADLIWCFVDMWSQEQVVPFVPPLLL